MTRRPYLGGSDAAAALGLSPWKTPLELWLEKTGRDDGARVETAPMRWGTKLEAVVAEAYAEETGHTLAMVDRLVHPDHPFLVGHLDRVTTDTPMRVVEVKTARRGEGWGEEHSDDIPDHYAIQGLVYLALVPHAVACDFPVLIGGNDFRIYTLPRAQELCDEIIDQLARWWHDHVVGDRAPDPVTTQDFQRAWKAHQGKRAVVGARELEIARALATAKAEVKKWEKVEETYANDLRGWMQDATELVGPGDQLIATWREQNATRFDLAAFEAAHPDLAAQFRKTTTSRVLRLKIKE